MHECEWDECRAPFDVRDSDAAFPTIYCSSGCQVAADAESEAV